MTAPSTSPAPALSPTDWTKAAAAFSEAKGAAHRLLCALAARARRSGDKRGMCWPSLSRLMDDTGLARSTLQAALRRLIAQGLVVIVEKGGGRLATRYRLTHPSTWGKSARCEAPISDALRGPISGPQGSENRTHNLRKELIEDSPLPPVGGDAGHSSNSEEQESANDPTSAPAPQPEPDAQAALATFEQIAKAQGWRGGSILTPKRRRRIAARLKECGGLEGWKQVLTDAARSTFVNRIKPGLDFFASPESFAKLRAGEYGPQKARTGAPGASPMPSAQNGAAASQEGSMRPWRALMTGKLDFAIMDVPSSALKEGMDEAAKRGMRPLEAKAFALWRWREAQGDA